MTVKVVYILGSAYSGSTVLGALLGSHAEITCLGELARWTRYSNPGTRRCSCGDLVSDCPFWARVAHDWGASSDGDTQEAYAALQPHYERIRDIPLILLQRWQRRQDFDSYRSKTRSLMETIAKVAKKNTLVDTSKLPARGLAMAMTENMDVRFIHLVRDGLTFLDSYAKREGYRAQSGIALPIPAKLAARASLRWALANLASEAAIRAAQSPWLRLRYETLSDDLPGSMALLSEVIGSDLRVVGERAAKGQEVAFRHMVAGNDVRLRGAVPFRPHSPPGDAIAPSTRKLFRLLAGPIARRYGY